MVAVVINDKARLEGLLAHIFEREEPKLLFIDLEGVDLSRNGIVAIMQLLMPPLPTVYLIDVHALGSIAFDTNLESGLSLRTILESATIFKVFFDIRNDSDALHAHFGINVAGIIDLQVVEYATRRPRGRFVNGLAKCIERDLAYVPEWSTVKNNGRRLFAPEMGGSYDVFLERPMLEDIIKYCEQDVMLMPRLLVLYGSKMRADVATQLQEIVDERIALSKTRTFNGKGRHMAIGPALITAWNASRLTLSPEMELVCSADLHRLCQIDSDQVDGLASQLEAQRIDQDDEGALLESSTSFGDNMNRVTPIDSYRVVFPEAAVSAEAPLPSPASPLSGSPDFAEWSSDDDGHHTWQVSSNTYGTDSDNLSDKDYTACSADDCGYCGRCGY